MVDKLKVPKTMQPVFDTIAGIIDGNCTGNSRSSMDHFDLFLHL